jgi:hypothetical protein
MTGRIEHGLEKDGLLRGGPLGGVSELETENGVSYADPISVFELARDGPSPIDLGPVLAAEIAALEAAVRDPDLQVLAGGCRVVDYEVAAGGAADNHRRAHRQPAFLLTVPGNNESLVHPLLTLRPAIPHTTLARPAATCKV